MPGAQGAPAGLTPEQSKRPGFGDKCQGVHGPQVEQAHQDDVPPNDDQPLPALAQSRGVTAALRDLDPRTDLLLGVAEGDLPPVGGRARHGCGGVGARGSGSGSGSARPAPRSPVGAGASAFWGWGGVVSALPSPPSRLLGFLRSSSGVQRGPRMPVCAPGICCWRIAAAAAGAELRCEEEEASAGGGRGRGAGGRRVAREREGALGGSRGRKTCIATANQDGSWGS